jgi:5'(3')-deoxyribonucleotidase
MRVIVDMDGVLSDWRRGVLIEFEKQGLTLLPSEYWTSRRIEKWVLPGEEKNAAEVVNKLMLRPGFWESLELIQGAKEYFTRLHYLLREDLYIGTVPWWSSPSCAHEKVQWVMKHFPSFDVYKHLIMGHPKWMLDADLLIDDSAEQIIPWAASGRSAIVVDYQYNQEVRANNRRVFRARTWEEIFKIVGDLYRDEQERRA